MTKAAAGAARAARRVADRKYDRHLSYSAARAGQRAGQGPRGGDGRGHPEGLLRRRHRPASTSGRAGGSLGLDGGRPPPGPGRAAAHTRRPAGGKSSSGTPGRGGGVGRGMAAGPRPPNCMRLAFNLTPPPAAESLCSELLRFNKEMYTQYTGWREACVYACRCDLKNTRKSSETAPLEKLMLILKITCVFHGKHVTEVI